MEPAMTMVANRNEDDTIIWVCVGEKRTEQHRGRLKIQFVQPQHDLQRLARYYQAADLHVHATKAETFGMTLAESLATGTPVVATSVGSVPEVVEDGVTGFLTPPNDVVAMAAQIERVLNDDDLRHNLSSQAVQSAQRFGIDRQAHEFLEWYETLIA